MLWLLYLSFDISGLKLSKSNRFCGTLIKLDATHLSLHDKFELSSYEDMHVLTPYKVCSAKYIFDKIIKISKSIFDIP